MFRPKGSTGASWDRVKQVKLKPPPAGGSPLGAHHKGVAHGDLVAAVKRAAGAEPHKAALSKDQYDLAASFLLKDGPGTPKGYRYEIAVLTSNARRFPLMTFYGFACKETGRGLVLGRVCDDAKHTTGFDLTGWAEDVGRRAPALFSRAKEKLQELADRKLDDRTKDSVLMAAGRGGLIPWSRVGGVDLAWAKPAYTATGPRTALSLYHCFSVGIAKCPALSQLGLLEGFYGLIGTAPAPAPAPAPAAGKPARRAV